MENEILNLLKKLEKYSFILGVIDQDDRKGKNEDDPTNSEILMLHELGSPLKKIPARPILDYVINHQYTQDLLDELIETCIVLALENKEAEILAEHERVAVKIENFLKKTLQRGDHNLKPLSPQRIKEKGSNLPLWDTGQLAKSIVCRVKIK